jgi:hypothetical protein
MGDDTPQFFQEADHEFTVGEHVYVIDNNGFDIFDAVISDLQDSQIQVDYPDWPDDAGWVERERVIPSNRANDAIFNAQERIRKQKEREEEEEDDADAYEDKQKVKPKASKPKTRPPKQKPVREKKPPKEPKPPKPPKEKKAKPPKPPKPPKAVAKPKEVPRERPPKPTPIAAGSSDDEQSFSESDESIEPAEPEIPHFDEPERLIIPEPEREVEDAIELRFPPALPGVAAGSTDEVGDMAIRFGAGGAANCFIYRVDSGEEWLILNGMKFRMRPFGDEMENEGLYYESKVRGRGGLKYTDAVIYPAVRLGRSQKVVQAPECNQFQEWLAKEKRKKESVAFTDVHQAPSSSAPKQRRKAKREREFTEEGIESSSSDD